MSGICGAVDTEGTGLGLYAGGEGSAKRSFECAVLAESDSSGVDLESASLPVMIMVSSERMKLYK
jgi:hypothetical protein